MPRVRERTPPTRYVEPEATIEAPEGRHYALGASWVLFAITLLGLFASASIQGGGIHGWYWALAAVPAALLGLSLLLTARAVRRSRRLSAQP